MTWLFEDPTPVVVIGVFLEVILAVVLYRTARGAALIAMIAVLLMTSAVVLVAWLVVTENERVQDTLYRAASAVESNNPAAVLAFVSPDATGLRNTIQTVLPHFTIESVSIKNNLKVTINKLTSPPSATATFNVVVVGGEKRGGVKGQIYPAYLIVTLQQVQDRWLVTAYEERNFREGL